MENQVFKPILFSTPMVQAIIDERKTQTRRMIKPQPVETNYDKSMYGDRELTLNSLKNHAKYRVGDVLWVRETFCTAENWDHWPAGSLFDSIGFNYKADTDNDYMPKFLHRGRWRPSIHMPKIVCRIFLEVTKVRAERLQDISEEDAISEGIIKHSDYGSSGYVLYTEPEAAYTDIDAVYSFESLWESINGKDSWEANPWVWVYDFKRVEKPAAFLSNNSNLKSKIYYLNQ